MSFLFVCLVDWFYFPALHIKFYVSFFVRKESVMHHVSDIVFKQHLHFVMTGSPKSEQKTDHSGNRKGFQSCIVIL